MTRTPIRLTLVVLAVAAMGVSSYFTVFGGSGGLLAGPASSVPYEIRPTDLVHGSPNAPVTIIEYASMTCSACAGFAINTLPQLRREYIDTGKVRLVFREYPLDGIARIASAATRCFEGDAAFNFIDLLFQNQQGPNGWIKDFDGDMQMTQQDVEEGLARMGRVAGMSREQIITGSRDPAKLALVDANWTEGRTRYNVGSTPTFIINGNVHRGGLTFAAIKAAIDPLL